MHKPRCLASGSLSPPGQGSRSSRGASRSFSPALPKRRALGHSMKRFRRKQPQSCAEKGGVLGGVRSTQTTPFLLPATHAGSPALYETPLLRGCLCRASDRDGVLRGSMDAANPGPPGHSSCLGAAGHGPCAFLQPAQPDLALALARAAPVVTGKGKLGQVEAGCPRHGLHAQPCPWLAWQRCFPPPRNSPLLWQMPGPPRAPCLRTAQQKGAGAAAADEKGRALPTPAGAAHAPPRDPGTSWRGAAGFMHAVGGEKCPGVMGTPPPQGPKDCIAGGGWAER